MPPETGDSFLANSVIKSDAVHQFTGSITLADDSGLAVEAASMGRLVSTRLDM